MKALHKSIGVAALCLTGFAAIADEGYEPAEYLPKDQYQSSGNRQPNDAAITRPTASQAVREAPQLSANVASEKAQPVPQAENTQDGMPTIGLLGLLAVIGIVAYRRLRPSPVQVGGQGAGAEVAAGTPTGVQRYIETTQPSSTGVARYLQRHAASEPLTGVAKYLIKQKLRH